MNRNPKRNTRNIIRLIVTYTIPLLILVFAFTMLNQNRKASTEFTFSQVVDKLRTGDVKQLQLQDGKVIGVLQNNNTFSSYIPDGMQDTFYDTYLKSHVEDGSLSVSMLPKAETPWIVTMLPDLFFFGIILFFLYRSFNRMQNGGAPGINNFGKSKARLNRNEDNPVSFRDVAGLKEEKEELGEIVDFLKNPRRFTDRGARIPKGVLLVGPPGTGKTYLSRAVAGEAGVPFYSISGSDFVEMFVGVGASRVRDLFEEGKKAAPCIIFIDEIDAVGRRRGAGLGGGNDEREQTLNQLLVEMDGFDVNEGIIIMAATNRPDILDPALMRPGRFDRQVFVGMPDVAEREAILRIHLRNKPLDEGINLTAVAKMTGGFTPADLENVCNEAALLSARKNLPAITEEIFEEAAIKVVAGPEKKSKKVIEEERRLTAYHESGHAIVTKSMPSNETVNMITIVPRGMAGGFTSFLPEDDRSFMSRNEMRARLVSFLAGRAAEDLMLDDISTGASNDIERATQLARSMVTKYGMSEALGPINYNDEGDNVFVGMDFGKVRSYSEETAMRIDRDVEKTMQDAYRKALDILKENTELLNILAQRLLEVETIRREEFDALFDRYGHTAQIA